MKKKGAFGGVVSLLQLFYDLRTKESLLGDTSDSTRLSALACTTAPQASSETQHACLRYFDYNVLVLCSTDVLDQVFGKMVCRSTHCQCYRCQGLFESLVQELQTGCFRSGCASTVLFLFCIESI